MLWMLINYSIMQIMKKQLAVYSQLRNSVKQGGESIPTDLSLDKKSGEKNPVRPMDFFWRLQPFQTLLVIQHCNI